MAKPNSIWPCESITDLSQIWSTKREVWLIHKITWCLLRSHSKLHHTLQQTKHCSPQRLANDNHSTKDGSEPDHSHTSETRMISICTVTHSLWVSMNITLLDCIGRLADRSACSTVQNSFVLLLPWLRLWKPTYLDLLPLCIQLRLLEAHLRCFLCGFCKERHGGRYSAFQFKISSQIWIVRIYRDVIAESAVVFYKQK